MIQVVLTHDEIIDACRRYLSDRGMPLHESQTLDLGISHEEVVNGNRAQFVKAVVRVQCDYFVGPYR